MGLSSVTTTLLCPVMLLLSRLAYLSRPEAIYTGERLRRCGECFRGAAPRTEDAAEASEEVSAATARVRPPRPSNWGAMTKNQKKNLINRH